MDTIRSFNNLLLKWSFEFVTFPIDTMVDPSIVVCQGLPEGSDQTLIVTTSFNHALTHIVIITITASESTNMNRIVVDIGGYC